MRGDNEGGERECGGARMLARWLLYERCGVRVSASAEAK